MVQNIYCINTNIQACRQASTESLEVCSVRGNSSSAIAAISQLVRSLGIKPDNRALVQDRLKKGRVRKAIGDVDPSSLLPENETRNLTMGAYA